MRRSLLKKSRYSSDFDADYQAVLDYATLQGITHPTQSQNTINNQIILNLKTEGVWNELDTFWYFKQDANLDFVKINWKNPIKYYLSEVGLVGFINNIGITVGDNGTAYFNTNYIPNIDGIKYQYNDMSIIFKRHNLGDGSSGLFIYGGRSNSSDSRQTYIQVNNTGVNWLCRFNNRLDPTANTLPTKDNHIHISKNNGLKNIYEKGILTSTINITGGGLPTVDQYLLAVKNGGNLSAPNDGLHYFLQGSNLNNKQLEIYQILNLIY